jgi:CDP-diacylglycerol---glycerol-3-phosphate 3-phosphatidyltransferase
VRKYIPNALTILRLVLTPVFLWLAFLCTHENALHWAWIVFVIACITDWLDGFLARKFNVISDFGKIIDPLADKLIVLAALAALTWKDPIRLHWLVFAIIAFREALVSVLRKILVRRLIILSADIWGKIKTVMQMAGIIFSLGCMAISYTLAWVINASRIWFWIVVVATLLSGFNYIRAIR